MNVFSMSPLRFVRHLLEFSYILVDDLLPLCSFAGTALFVSSGPLIFMLLEQIIELLSLIVQQLRCKQVIHQIPLGR